MAPTSAPRDPETPSSVYPTLRWTKTESVPSCDTTIENEKIAWRARYFVSIILILWHHRRANKTAVSHGTCRVPCTIAVVIKKSDLQVVGLVGITSVTTATDVTNPVLATRSLCTLAFISHSAIYADSFAAAASTFALASLRAAADKCSDPLIFLTAALNRLAASSYSASPSLLIAVN